LAEYIYLLLTLALIVRKDHSGRLVVVKKRNKRINIQQWFAGCSGVMAF